MRRRAVMLMAQVFACAALVASCASDSPAAVDTVKLPVLTLVSPEVIRVTDGLRPVADTLVIALREGTGEPRQNAKVFATGTTGWVRELPSGGWSRPWVMLTDTTGHVRFLWLPSASGPQRLELFSMGPVNLSRSLPLARSGVPLRADSVVPSGSEAVCFQKDGRIGCVGLGACGVCGTGTAPGLAFDAVHWFRLTAPPRRLTSTLSGACALLVDGNTSCWNGLGPDSVARNDVGHPPFVEFTGSIGRTADGAVWKGVISGSTGFAQGFAERTWNRIPSDSVITALLTDFDETFLCARTASDAVMCSIADRGLLEPSVIMRPFRLLRTGSDSSVVRGTTGYTALLYASDAPRPSVVVRTASGTALRFTAPSALASSWYGISTADSSLSGPDVHVRSCVPLLDARCDPGAPWRSVFEAGRATYGAGFGESGFRRTCGVRDVIVCHLRLSSRPGQGSLGFRFEILDTIRLAP